MKKFDVLINKTSTLHTVYECIDASAITCCRGLIAVVKLLAKKEENKQTRIIKDTFQAAE